MLVNNAGMSLLYDDLAEVTEAMWEKVVGLNLKGPFRLTALVGPRMAAGNGGSIINVSSTGSIRPAPFMLPYDAAKAGLNALTVGFAHAYGPTVRVNCIMAGPFFTDVAEHWDLAAFEAEASRRHALGRGGQPDEIVGAALYFAFGGVELRHRRGAAGRRRNSLSVGSRGAHAVGRPPGTVTVSVSRPERSTAPGWPRSAPRRPRSRSR